MDQIRSQEIGFIEKKQGYFPCFTTNYTFMGIKINEIIFGIEDTWKDGKIDGKIK